jgi:glycosyltransferase involved in cell wall biosynthesis
VYQQTYRPIECIIIDDGSTDGTNNWVNQLSFTNDNDFQIKYIFQKNAGAQFARNKGSEAAAGEFIQYLDSDDILYPEKLERQVRFLREHPEFDGVFGDWDKGLPEKKEQITAYCSDDLITQMLTDRCIHTLSFLFRKNVYARAGGWDPGIKRNQEIDFHVRAVLNGAKFSYLPGIAGLWRTHNDERIANSTNLNDVVFFFQKMEKLLIERELFTSQLKVKIASLYLWLVDENIEQPKILLIPAVNEAYRLNPNIILAPQFMFRLFNKYFGLSAAISVWLFMRKTIK